MKRAAAFLFLLMSVFGYGQQLSFIRPGNLAKLPSSECYNIIQDSRGYIWFSTEAGLCRYNGSAVKVYGKQKGLPEEATYQLFEDKHKVIWMVTARNRILRYNEGKDSLEEAPFSKSYVATLKSGLGQAYLAQPDGDSLLWVSSQLTTYKINIRSGQLTLVSGDSTNYTLSKRGSQLIQLKTAFRLSQTDEIVQQKFTTITIHDGPRKKVLKIKRDEGRLPVWRLLNVTNRKGEHFIAYDNMLVKVNADLSYQSFHCDAVVLTMHLDKDDGLWLNRSKGGFVYYPQCVIADSMKITGLPGLSVTGVCEDHEGGIWCTTLEKGVFYSRSKKVLNFANIPGLDKRNELLKSEAGRLFVSGEANELTWTSGKTFHKESFPNSINSGLSDILSYKGGWLVSGKREVLFTDASFKNVKQLKTLSNTRPGVNQMARYKDKVFGVQFGALIEITGNMCTVRINPLLYPGRSILCTRKEDLIMGGRAGLARVDLNTFTQKKIDGIQGSVAKLAEDSAGTLWIPTKDNGLYTITNGRIEKLSDSMRLPTSRFSDIAFDRYGTAWLATNEGILRIKGKKTKKEYALLDMSSGLPSEEVSAVAILNDVLYASTQDGLCCFPIDAELTNEASPPIYISSTRVNDSLIEFRDGAKLPYYENNLKLFADVLSYKQPFESPRMFYLLAGLDKNIHFVEGREWMVNNLAPGFYTLFLYALNNDGKTSARPVKLSFTILRPYWQRPMFLIGAFIILISLMAIVVNTLLRSVRRKEEEKTRINTLIAQYHMSALRAQMNPHFIFNCINSIQRFVITNRAEEAYDYLAKFSKLIRLVLNFAEENFVTLEQELEVVRLYLALEQMRVDNKFDWSIECAKDVKTNEMEVPVMMLQPYVENAIWHGVMNLPKDKRGKITILIEYSTREQLLEVVIEDNGIGRQKAAQLAARNHRSKATGINQKRSEMMNILSGSNTGRIQIEDLVDAQHVPTGTKVKIFISQKTEKHENG